MPPRRGPFRLAVEKWLDDHPKWMKTHFQTAGPESALAYKSLMEAGWNALTNEEKNKFGSLSNKKFKQKIQTALVEI